MKKFIILIFFLIYGISQLYSQEKSISNVFQLYNTLKDTTNLSKEQRKEYGREYWFLSTRYDSNGTIDGYKDAVYKFFKQETLPSAMSLSSIEDVEWNYLGPKGLDFHGI